MLRDISTHQFVGSEVAAWTIFDPYNIAANSSWSQIVHKTGWCQYLCTFNPAMKATLVVE